MSDQPTSIEPIELEPEESEPPESAAPRRRVWRWIAVVVVALVVLGALGYGGYKINRDDGEIKSLDGEVATLQAQIGQTAGMNATLHTLSQQIAEIQTTVNVANSTLNAVSTQQRRDETAMNIAAQSAFCAAAGVDAIANGGSPGLIC
jgi:hypothetical protein